MTFKVAIFGRVHEAGIAMLHDHPDITATLVEHDDPETLKQLMPGLHAVTVRTAELREDLLSLAPELKMVSKHGIGTDNIAVDYLTSRNIPVAIAVGGNDRSVAEHALMLILACAKRLPVLDQWVRSHQWDNRLGNIGRDVEGKTLLIVGLGRIGRQLARMAAAIDMQVIAYDPVLSAHGQKPDGIPLHDDLSRALAMADYVSLHMPLTASSRGLLNAQTFATMKDGACLIDCARGHIVDEAALIDALDSGKLAFAGMDVFADEPPRPDDPLLTHDRVILSPHAAALTEEGAMRMATIMARNVIDGLHGTLRPDVVLNRAQLT